MESAAMISATIGLVGIVLAYLLARNGALQNAHLATITETLRELKDQLKRLDDKKANKDAMIDCQVGCSKEMGHLQRDIEQLREAKV